MAKGCQREAKGGQGEAKGGQRQAKERPREAKGRPRVPKGRPRRGQGEAKGGQGRPGQARRPKNLKKSVFWISFWLPFWRHRASKSQPKSEKRSLENRALVREWCAFRERRPSQARPERPRKARPSQGRPERPEGRAAALRLIGFWRPEAFTTPLKMGPAHFEREGLAKPGQRGLEKKTKPGNAKKAKAASPGRLSGTDFRGRRFLPPP